MSDRPDDGPAGEAPLPRALRRGGELVVGALVALSPWPLASSAAGPEYLLGLGVLLLTALWAAHAAAVGRLGFRPDAVSVALAGLVLLSAGQLAPLPEAVVGVLSPARLEWHRTLTPAVAETLPGGGGAVARPTWLPLTVDAAATRTFLARALGLLLLYAAVRNWVASRAALGRFAVGMTVLGTLLAFLALLDGFAGTPGTVLWVLPVPPAADATYGPFVCRNHYPDLLHLALGMAVALLLPRAGDGGEDRTPRARASARRTPRALALTAAVALMAASVPFSLSRGGVLAGAAAGGFAWLLALLRPAKEAYAAPVGPARFGLAAALVLGVLGLGWLGTGVAERRLAALGRADAVASRWPLWQDAARLVPRTWGVGAGGGSFVSLEGTVRDANRAGATFYYDSAHNEYLEALVEGGLPRLALTLLLAGGPLVVMGRGYRARHHRTVGPYLLGAWFGLAALALHAVTDFGVHLPAVAVAAAVTAGFGMAAAVDPGFVPARVRVWRVRSADAVATVLEPDAPVEAPTGPRDPAWHARGVWAVAAGLGLGLAALAVVGESQSRARAERLEREAEAAFWDAGNPRRLADRAATYARRAAARPGDGAALFDAGQAALDAAAFDTWTASAAAVGGPLGFLHPPEAVPESVRVGALRDGLAWLQLARAANPMLPKVHARLAVHAGAFPSGEPAAAHFARAKRLLPADPDIWYAAGREAFRRGDDVAARADWSHSLGVSTRHVGPVVAALRTRTPPDALRAGLPRDPAVLLAAMNALHPDRAADAAGRAPYLLDVLALTEVRADPSPGELASLAECYDELGRPDDAAVTMLKMYAGHPDDAEVRDRYARFLESTDRYDEAVPILEALRRQRPGDVAAADRLDAARHAARLIAEIRAK